MALGSNTAADSGKTLGGPVFSSGVTSNWTVIMDATGVSTADTLTNFDPDVDLTRSVVHDMTFNGNEGSMVQVAIEYPSTMTASTVAAEIIAFGKDDNGRWEPLITAGGSSSASISTSLTADPRYGTVRLAKAPYASSFLRNGCKTIRFATKTAMTAGTGVTSARLLAKVVA